MKAKSDLKNGGTAERTYLTVQEVADYLRLSCHAIYAWIAKGTLPVALYRIGCPGVGKRHQQIRFLKADIDAWMDRQKKIPAGLEYGLEKNSSMS